MKRHLPLLFVLIFSSMSLAQDYSAMTFNIRYDTERDGINRWDNRKTWVTEIIADYKPDFFGLQEALHHQVTYVDSVLSDYSFVGVGRDDGKMKGEYTPLFFNSKKFKVIDSRTFWLSETPDAPSVGWDAALERISTYALLENKETKSFILVFNAHLDHMGAESRLNSLKLIQEVEGMQDQRNVPTIVMGDFNAVPDSDPIQFFSKHFDDTYSSTTPVGPIGTYHGFNKDSELKDRIDYIFSRGLKVNYYQNIDLRVNDFFPSDHTPIYVQFRNSN